MAPFQQGLQLGRHLGQRLLDDAQPVGGLARHQVDPGQARIGVDAVLYEARLPLRRMMGLNVGDTLMLEIKPDAMVTVRCGDITLTEGRMGRVGDRVAVRVAKPLRKPRTTFAMFEKADETTTTTPLEVP